jgi:ABC-type cobalamin transport system ATPase subunit
MALTERNKTVKTSRRTVRVTGRTWGNPQAPSATIVINGDVQPVGTIVELSDADARILIARGLAVDATAGEVAAAGQAIVIAAVYDQDNWSDA